MPTPRITTLVFDFGRVITRNQDLGMAAEMASVFGVPQDVFSSAYYSERSEYDRGSFDAADYWARIASALGATLDTATVAKLIQLDLDSWFMINGEMTDLIAELKTRVDRLVLLSNIPIEGRDRLRSRCAWTAMFDELVLSCEHKVIKPEREIYEICLAAAGSPPEHCLFVDDIGTNIEGARSLGMHGHVFTDVESLKRRLATDFTLSR